MSDRPDTAKPNVVLVCGGRDYSDADLVAVVLGRLDPPADVIVTGGASGADALATLWAKRNSVGVVQYVADWRHHGKAAGPIRNQRMIDVEQPTLVVAFPGGRGTADMVSRAISARIPVLDAQWVEDSP